MATFRFEELIVWQRAIDLADLVYDFTEAFPQAEQFGITNQMRPAVVSVSSNIAEGDARTSSKDRIRFLEIAYGSLMEVISQATIAVRRRYLSEAYRDECVTRRNPLQRCSADCANAGRLIDLFSTCPLPLASRPCN